MKYQNRFYYSARVRIKRQLSYSMFSIYQIFGGIGVQNKDKKRKIKSQAVLF